MPEENVNNTEETVPAQSVIIEPFGLESTMWIAGAESGVPYKAILDSGDWTQYAPTYESQTRPGFDAVSCVTYSGENCLEPQLNRLFQLGQLSQETMDFLNQNKYLDENGKFNFSDRFSAIVDGTTPNGNYMSNAPDSFAKDGLIPEWMLPFPEDIAASVTPGVFDGKAIKAYLDPAVITQEMRDLGHKFLTFFDIRYENIWYGNFGAPDMATIRYHLKQAPLHFAATVCGGENQENVIAACGCGASHARSIYNALPENSYMTIFDSFFKAQKKVANDFCMPYLYKIVITPKGETVPTNKFSYTFTSRLVPESLRKAQPNVYPENDGGSVVALQRTLQALIDSATGKPYLDPRIIPVQNFGPLTTAALVRFQIDRKVASPGEIKIAQGTVGPKTRDALNAALIAYNKQ